ncbi:MAG: DNA-binding protein [Gemmatimonadaceae bacterium]
MAAKKSAGKSAKKSATKAVKKAIASEGASPKGVSQPATRALASIGVTKVDQLTKHRESDVAMLHGMGPKALGILKAELKSQGKSFKAQSSK